MCVLGVFLRGHRDHDDGGQDPAQGGADQHRLVIYGGPADGSPAERSGRVRFDLIGAHRHHHLEHLVHLVVLVAQVENDTLNNTAMLRASTGISKCLPSAVQFVLCKLCELFIAWIFLCARRAGGKGRRMRATAHLAPH